MSIALRMLFLQLVCMLVVSVTSNGYQVPYNTASVTTTISLPAGYVYYPTVNAAYKIHQDKLSWSNAKDACASEGGRLAVIDTLEKVEFINRIRNPSTNVWVGIEKKNDNWVTADTQARLFYLPWGTNQPYGIGDCAAVKKSGTGLKSRMCFWSEPYVCEIRTATVVPQNGYYQQPTKNGHYIP
ncbi:hemolymph lipopolysaccharide-binding protein-like [Diprion similis]|uniref:hemolymph lipopolysaccharide-binding protein-like n=1 Tax=Diprion similis TaxID=362088 RepID=UPI001EF97AEC|nr:hemolymph lipopolysaccharide-binding protein-like [Diprion similis]